MEYECVEQESTRTAADFVYIILYYYFNDYYIMEFYIEKKVQKKVSANNIITIFLIGSKTWQHSHVVLFLTLRF